MWVGVCLHVFVFDSPIICIFVWPDISVFVTVFTCVCEVLECVFACLFVCVCLCVCVCACVCTCMYECYVLLMHDQAKKNNNCDHIICICQNGLSEKEVVPDIIQHCWKNTLIPVLIIACRVASEKVCPCVPFISVFCCTSSSMFCSL